MTVIAWDGKTLAADKRSSQGSLIRTISKISRVHMDLVGYAGESALGVEMVNWLRSGADASNFPSFQRDSKDWVELLVIKPDKRILRYERSPIPVEYQDEKFAIGSGRDFALAAMHLGCSAAEAVALASEFDSDCGNGVDALTL